MSGVSIFCFAASYAVALALEITRLLFRSGIRGAFMLGFAAAGLFAHTVYLFHRIVESYREVGAVGAPLSSQQEWYLIAAWLLAIVYLYMTCYHAHVPFGLFILPLVLGLIAVGAFVADPQPSGREPASAAWGLVHGISLLLATVAVLVGLAAGLMYLGQDRRLKTKAAPAFGLRLPSLEKLQQINSRSLVIALIMMGVGILSGITLNLTHRAGDRPLPWHDPVVLASVLMFGWLLVASIIGVAYRPVRKGRKVAYLTVVSFVFLVIALWSVMGNVTRHLGGSDSGAVPRASEVLKTSKCETRSSKCETNLNDRRPKYKTSTDDPAQGVWSISIWGFGFVSDFGFRASCFDRCFAALGSVKAPPARGGLA